MMVAIGGSFRCGANRCSPLGIPHSERVFGEQPPSKPKPSRGLRALEENPEHVFDLGGEQAYAQPMTKDNTNPIARLGESQR